MVVPWCVHGTTYWYEFLLPMCALIVVPPHWVRAAVATDPRESCAGRTVHPAHAHPTGSPKRDATLPMALQLGWRKCWDAFVSGTSATVEPRVLQPQDGRRGPEARRHQSQQARQLDPHTTSGIRVPTCTCLLDTYRVLPMVAW
jgi:hypothetical protein